MVENRCEAHVASRGRDMQRIGAVAAGVALAFCLGGCSTIDVATDYLPGTSFSAYKTFDFLPEQGLKNPFLRERAESAVTRELTAKGLTRVASGAALLVAMHGRFDTRTEIDTAGFGYRSRWGYWGAAGVHTTVREVPVGTLIVDLVDGDRRELVWQGRASAVVSRGGTPESRQERIDEAMAELFAKFPPAS